MLGRRRERARSRVLRVIVLFVLALALAPFASAQEAATDPSVAAAPEVAAEPAARGTHARGHFAAQGALGIPTSERSLLVGGGVIAGFDVAMHPNHDVGLRASLTINGLFHKMPITPHFWGLALLGYRFHDDVVIERVAPFLQLGAGVGIYGGCIAGDLCGGIGPAFELGGGVEYALNDAFSVVFGAQLLFQLGLANGVALLFAPTLFVGIRLG